MTVGISSPGVLSADLDIPFTQDNFGPAVPQFGGFDTPAGGQIGMAILSDIEAFFLLQAAQSDDRSNVLSAPKVTLFDGQAASVYSDTQIPFVTALTPVVDAGSITLGPTSTSPDFPGSELNVSAVVSADRRFVVLPETRFFTNVTVEPPIGVVGNYNETNGFNVTKTSDGNDQVTPVPEGTGNVRRTYHPSPASADSFSRSGGTRGADGPDQWALRHIGLTPEMPATFDPGGDSGQEPVVVALIDTGVDLSHPELLGNSGVIGAKSLSTASTTTATATSTTSTATTRLPTMTTCGMETVTVRTWPALSRLAATDGASPASARTAG